MGRRGRRRAPFIGFTGLAVPGFPVPGHEDGCVEVGWRLAADQWGRGYAPEAARAALDVAWDLAGLDEVVSFTSVGNASSRRVMEKIGLTFEREFDHPRLDAADPLRRHVLYAVTRGRGR